VADNLTKFEIRIRFAELRDLLCEFDPIGVMDEAEWPRDEYDCMIGPLVTMLQANASKSDLADFIEQEITDHFGLESDHASAEKFAGQLDSWYKSYWVSREAPVTIFNELDDEGVPVWRPVEGRPIGNHVFRIVGPNPRPDDETWTFPLGSVVRCEERSLSGNDVGLVAVELVRAPRH
jgi:hypothetical protein